MSALSGLTIQQILDLDVENLAIKIDKHHCQTKKAVLVSLIMMSQGEKGYSAFCMVRYHIHSASIHFSSIQFDSPIFLPESVSLLCLCHSLSRTTSWTQRPASCPTSHKPSRKNAGMGTAESMQNRCRKRVIHSIALHCFSNTMPTVSFSHISYMSMRLNCASWLHDVNSCLTPCTSCFMKAEVDLLKSDLNTALFRSGKLSEVMYRTSAAYDLAKVPSP